MVTTPALGVWVRPCTAVVEDAFVEDFGADEGDWFEDHLGVDSVF